MLQGNVFFVHIYCHIEGTKAYRLLLTVHMAPDFQEVLSSCNRTASKKTAIVHSACSILISYVCYHIEGPKASRAVLAMDMTNSF